MQDHDERGKGRLNWPRKRELKFWGFHVKHFRKYWLILRQLKA